MGSAAAAAAAAGSSSSSSKVRTPSHPFRVIEPDTRSQASADSRSVQSRSSYIPGSTTSQGARKYSEAGLKFAEVRGSVVFLAPFGHPHAASCSTIDIVHQVKSVDGENDQYLLPPPSVGQFGLIRRDWLTERWRLLAATEWTFSILKRVFSELKCVRQCESAGDGFHRRRTE